MVSPTSPNKAQKDIHPFVWMVLLTGFCVLILHSAGTNDSNSRTAALSTSSPFRGSNSVKTASLKDFIQTNDRLIITDDKLKVTDCSCGCLESKILSCPRHYTLRDVEKSATVSVTRDIANYIDFALQEKRRSSQISCVASDTQYKAHLHHTDSGGYCLSAFLQLTKELGESRGSVIIPFPDRTIPVPKGHAMADEDMINLLAKFIEKEDITTFSDFGAGLGQYGMALECKFPDSLLYRAYDGAGDIEVYTQGFVKFFDFTIPLNLPVTEDWVMSLEVGEHVPADMEGMVIRNLHAHNCRGILLSWGIPGQGGLNHVNLHDSQYLIDIFEDLGYVFDVETTRHFRDSICPTGKQGACWFKTSFLALRRKKPVC